MSETDTARRAVTDQAAEAMRSAIIDEIRDATLDHLGREEATQTLRLISRAGTAMATALGVFGEVKNIYEMAMSVIDAWRLESRMVQRVAAAHAFGYWVYQRHGTYPPVQMPIGFQREMFASDRADRELGERIGRTDFSTDNGLSASDWQNKWSSAAYATMRGLDSALLDKAERGVLNPPLREALGSQVVLANPGRGNREAAQNLANLYRSVVIGATFRQSPALAARAFLLGSLSDEDSASRNYALRCFARNPYPAPD